MLKQNQAKFRKWNLVQTKKLFQILNFHQHQNRHAISHFCKTNDSHRTAFRRLLAKFLLRNCKSLIWILKKFKNRGLPRALKKTWLKLMMTTRKVRRNSTAQVMTLSVLKTMKGCHPSTKKLTSFNKFYNLMLCLEVIRKSRTKCHLLK